MEYSDHTKSALEQSADNVPIPLQLEVNAEILRTVRNMLTASHVAETDRQILRELTHTTLEAIAKTEERRGYGFDWPEQVRMLERALTIKDRYLPHLSLQHEIIGSTPDERILAEETLAPNQSETIFYERVWPNISAHLTKQNENPIAYIVGGQPGSGKSRLASTVSVQFNYDILHAEIGNFLGFHPHYQDLQERYGMHCIQITHEFARQMKKYAIEQAIKERCHLLIETNMNATTVTQNRIQMLKQAGYRVVILLRACPLEESWLNLTQLYEQQQLKAPAIARIVSREFHDDAGEKFVHTALAIWQEKQYDQLIVRSDRGLLYDSDDLPTENVAELLRERLRRD